MKSELREGSYHRPFGLGLVHDLDTILIAIKPSPYDNILVTELASVILPSPRNVVLQATIVQGIQCLLRNTT
jgi:hypothetical protein